ncbi:MAG: metal ABC transporter ATP-binding protein [bacterium]|nr:metal ABC transporter ATP-binding protein [bacterium]
MQPVISVQGLNFSLNGQKVLENISFRVQRGEYVGILGPNGGGKTSLLRLLLGLSQPETGSIELFGQRRSKFKDHHKLGYVPQHQGTGQLSFPASVAEVIETGLAARLKPWQRMGRAERLAMAQAIDLAQIGPLLNRNLSDLSGGERQRVYIARALAAGPELLFLDEPVAGVDLSAQNRFYQFLAQLNKELKLTLLFVSHDLGSIASQVSHVLCLNKRLICHGPPENFIKEEVMEQVFGPQTQSVLHHHH